MAAAVRATLYLRVSTGRQANSDLSIPDQRRQAKAYCASRGWEIAADYVEPGASATDDRRPEFRRMIDAATTKPPAFDVILVRSFSRFFRDRFQLEFYVRRLAKAGVRLVSITQELGDDPMSSTSSSVCYSPRVMSSFCRTYSIAAPSGPSDESCTSPNCASVAESAKTAGFGVRSSVPKWRAAADEDGHYCFAVALWANATKRASLAQSPTE
jgi:hypothetical protein